MSETPSIQYSEPSFTESEITRLAGLHQQVVNQHDTCSGVGIRVNGDGAAVECECNAVYRYFRRLVFARLPGNHWAADRCVSPELGSQLVVGPLQAGKTTWMVGAGIGAIWAGHRVHYVTAAEMIRFKIEAEKSPDAALLQERMLAADVLLIDNLTAAPQTEWSATYLEGVVREQLDRGAFCMVGAESVDKTSFWASRIERLAVILGGIAPVSRSVQTTRQPSLRADEWVQYVTEQGMKWNTKPTSTPTDW